MLMAYFILTEIQLEFIKGELLNFIKQIKRVPGIIAPEGISAVPIILMGRFILLTALLV
jgi:hypothetical protein